MNFIETLNNKLTESIDDINLPGLSTGKMGLSIYFYYLSRWERKDEYKQVADKLLNEVVNNLSNRMELSVESGLAGIASGIRHLVIEKFIEGDINELLEEVDSRIFKLLAFLKNDESKLPKQKIIQLLYYLYIRYKDQLSLGDKFHY
jgi:Lantibiotic modifying enzyme